MKKVTATTTQINILSKFLGRYTTGAIRRDLMLTNDQYVIRSIINPGYLSKGYISRVANIIYYTDALDTVQREYLWF